MTSFDTLRLAAPLLRALSDEGYRTPTPIQSAAIPPALAGRDLLGCAQTGTGKTAAFALPLLHALLEEGTAPDARRRPAPRALILAPTRELAGQIGESFAAYGRHTPLRCAVVFGGVSQHHQVKALARGAEILVATPGRLIDLVDQRLADLSAIRHLVLDEADRMLDMGFIQPIRRIASLLPTQRRTMLFSATMPPEIARLAESLLRNPVRVATTPVASAAPSIDQLVHHVDRPQKIALLQHLIEAMGVERAVVFTRTKRGADRLGKRLDREGISADSIHGDKAQNQRLRALDRFRSGRCRVLVATDVAARGLDVDGITHVFNYDLPDEPEAYVHRIGRTGRAGATGVAVAFCDPEERAQLREIERLIGRTIEVAATGRFASTAATQPAPKGAPGRAGAPDGRGSTRRGSAVGGRPGAATEPSTGPRRGRGKPAGAGHAAHMVGPRGPEVATATSVTDRGGSAAALAAAPSRRTTLRGWSRPTSRR